jgi:ATP-dependent Clp protease adaptor protein ClpS
MTVLIEKQKSKLAPPSMYKIIIHNDDSTDGIFVYNLLRDIFNKSPAESRSLVITAHEKGKATVGTYSNDVADTLLMKSRVYIAGFGVNVRNPNSPCELKITKELDC